VTLDSVTTINGTSDDGTSGSIFLQNCSNIVATKCDLSFDTLDYQSNSTNFVALNSSVNGTAANINIVIGDGYSVNGTKVLGAQQNAITAPTGGTTEDSESRTAISAIIAVLEAHGLTALP
jgi:hypothetical protein